MPRRFARSLAPSLSPAALAALSLAALSVAEARVAHAEELAVSDAAGLVTALAAAMAGDTIVLADGVYELGDVSCSADGTAAMPITVRAASPLGASVRFDAVEGFLVSGPHWHFEDLEVVGVCADDSSCEHAFHVVGRAEGFVLRNSRVLDFNAQLKVNSAPDGAGGYDTPHAGLVEGCELADTAPRDTSNPVTKLNIDTGDDWVVRGNYLHDFHKNGGNEISYGAFMKSGGQRGLFERNLVLCTESVATGGVRIGLSFGGGGTAPQFCAPAFDAAVPCDPEHTDGVMRNNVIVGCSDVGIYLNRAASTRVVHNTLIETTGVDYRFPSTTGEAHGNVVSSQIRVRDGASLVESENLEDVPLASFEGWFTAPLAGDLTLVAGADLSALVGVAATTTADVTSDYCLRDRGAQPHDLGALEVSLGACDTKPPPTGAGAEGGGAAGGASQGGASQGGAGGASQGGEGEGASAAGGAGASAGAPNGAAPASGGGCGCRAAPADTRHAGWLALALGALALRRRRR